MNKEKKMSNNKKVSHNKGVIKDNAIKALVRSNLFRHKVEEKRKGRGSYNRKKLGKIKHMRDDGSFMCFLF